MTERCAYCGSALPARTMPKAILTTAAGGPTSMDRIKRAARTVKSAASDKQIYNAIAALVRRKQLRRIAPGWYEARR